MGHQLKFANYDLFAHSENHVRKLHYHVKSGRIRWETHVGQDLKLISRASCEDYMHEGLKSIKERILLKKKTKKIPQCGSSSMKTLGRLENNMSHPPTSPTLGRQWTPCNGRLIWGAFLRLQV